MLNLYKMNEDEKREYNFPKEDNYYSFRDEQECFGFAKINYSEKVDIYIFIFEEKRGNGYGNELFSQVLEKIKKEGIRSFELIFPLKNVIMARILKRNKGIEDSRQGNIVKYILTIED